MRPAHGRSNAGIILKAEVVRAEGKKPKDNPRFVITNMKQSPQWLYEDVVLPAGRNREPNKRTARSSDRPYQLQRLLANQLRVLLTAAAYVLMQELRSKLRTPAVPELRSGHFVNGC